MSENSNYIIYIPKAHNHEIWAPILTLSFYQKERTIKYKHLWKSSNITIFFSIFSYFAFWSYGKRSYEFSSVRPSEKSFSQNPLISSFCFYMKLEGHKQIKVKKSDFLETSCYLGNEVKSSFFSPKIDFFQNISR